MKDAVRDVNGTLVLWIGGWRGEGKGEDWGKGEKKERKGGYIRVMDGWVMCIVFIIAKLS